MGWGVQGRCEQRSEVFVKIKKKKIFFFWGGGGGGGGVSVHVNEELKFLRKFKTKIYYYYFFFFLGGGGRVGGGGGGSGWM